MLRRCHIWEPRRISVHLKLKVSHKTIRNPIFYPKSDISAAISGQGESDALTLY
jgi:hypothetical protein